MCRVPQGLVDGRGGWAYRHSETLDGLKEVGNRNRLDDIGIATAFQELFFVAIHHESRDRDTVASFSLSTLPADGTLYTDATLTTPVATATDYAATAGSRTLYFVPDPDFNGAASFTFTAKDATGDSDPTPNVRYWG